MKVTPGGAFPSYSTIASTSEITRECEWSSAQE